MPIERRGQYRPRVEETGQTERVRLPRDREVFGVVEAMLGANRLRVRCSDDKMRVCRIPGRLRKRVWMREGDLIIVEPWQIQGDTNGDAVWKYTAAQVDWLKRKGFLKMEM